ncbi:hypothetical protein R4M03_02750 [Brachyspira pilosicoli]|uniref:Uncharacterized protein n=1 Tax=Brachyspira pilosicoli TaxID=52584 RepID=A0AAJ6KCD2_BRAPL|nr:hypothetical protein [Brachyspira pilosicoli]MBW5381812.1 hypothetical protein [Brachyspira pilosicoli]WIH89187.1 hypothetical protein NEI02_05660 [Brachyspira pilosicoli]WIH91482.1 hypothetical protein NEI01_05660 [Brachyspira pilosicoli]WIH93772.1 hypothetical protein NEH99_05645 [Brachyspira pilosicoli]
MRKYFTFITLLFLLSFFNLLHSQDISFEELYNKIKDNYTTIYPKRFDAYIEGKIVEAQISTIPAKNYLSSKDKIRLKFTLVQNSKPNIVLENVDSFYAKMFSVFEEPLETVGFYAIVSESYSSLSKKFTVDSIKEDNDKYEVILRAVGENKDYSINYTINKNSLLVESADYYNKKSKIYDVDISYTNIDNYTVPEIIKYKSSDGKVNSQIQFVDIKVSSK